LDESVATMVPKRTAGSVGVVASLVPVFAGLAASTALLVDYVRPRPVFCALGGGCDAVRHTVFAAPLGVPMPAIGIAGFLAVGVAALLPGPRARIVQMALSAAAGLLGLLLLAVQARMGDLCAYCCVADVSGMASALFAAARLAVLADLPPPRRTQLVAAGSMVLAVAVPLGVGLRASSVPPPIRMQIALTPKGHFTVVDFVDFECPFCRMTHAELEPMIEAHKQVVRRVRFQVPLRSHPHALDAARAACCGGRLGKGDAMANALFAAPVDELTREGCEKIAARLDLPLDAYRDCVADPATLARIDQDRAVFNQAGGYALPTIWIDEHEVVGAQSREVLAEAIADALARAGS
jgi:uncharacterized membrane protein/predicted DsbA family dithiol-disulfide isomerase